MWNNYRFSRSCKGVPIYSEVLCILHPVSTKFNISYAILYYTIKTRKLPWFNVEFMQTWTVTQLLVCVCTSMQFCACVASYNHHQSGYYSMPSQDFLWYSHIHPTPPLPWQSAVIPNPMIMLFNKCLANEIMQYVFFCDWLFSSSLIFLKVTHIVVFISSVILFCIAEDYSMIWCFHSLLNHLPIKKNH